MITYLINFMLCSALLLGAYHLLLKNKAMFVFNRWYLLTAVVLSLAAPAIIVAHNPMPKAAERVFVPVQKKLNLKFHIGSTNAVTVDRVISGHPVYQINICLVIYGVVASLLLLRFVINLLFIQRVIRKNDQVNYNGASLVLIPDNLTPHTFLNHIFLNKASYHQHKIESEVLNHELAHARQLHSADVLFIELIWAICWFNPFLLFYRRAIQLNHEFLADAAVINMDHDVNCYQQLLLSKMSDLTSFNITSQFNYSITKNRLIMMTKKTSASTALFCKLAVIPVMAIAIMAFSNKTVMPLKTPFKPTDDAIDAKYRIGAEDGWLINYPCTKEGISAQDWKQYIAIVAKYKTIVNGEDKVNENVSPADRSKLEAMYKRMSRAQQVKTAFHFLFYADRYPKAAPTKTVLNFWRNNKDYTITIDNKKATNKDLDKYQPADFASAWVRDRDQKSNDISYLIHDIFQSRRYNLNLLTTVYYNDFVAKHKESELAYATYAHGDSSNVTIHDSFYSHR
jgi:bla regulator protein BlaR1